MFDYSTIPCDPTPFEVAQGWQLLHQMEEEHWWFGFHSYPAGDNLWSEWHDQGYLAAAEQAAQLLAETEELYDALTLWMA